MNSTPARSVSLNRLAWILYVLLGLFAYLQGMMSPAIPYIRQEFHLDYTMSALHLSALAVGMVISGIATPPILARIGVVAGLWGGMAGALLGLAALVFAPVPAISLISILFMSFTGTMTLCAVQITLSRLFPERRAQVLLEANMVASFTSAAAPFIIVLGSLYFFGWRTVFPAFAIALAVVAVLGFRMTRDHAAQTPNMDQGKEGPMPRSFWRASLFIFVGVSVEWCVGFWSAEYLKGLPEKSIELAAAGAGVYQVACLAGRFISSRLTRRISERRILLIAMALVLVGFPLYWLRINVELAYAGLVLCGMGVCQFYPLGVSLSVVASGGNYAKAGSYAAVASGLAIGAAPLVLGRIADVSNLQTALWAIPIGIAVMAVLLIFERRHLKYTQT